MNFLGCKFKRSVFAFILCFLSLLISGCDSSSVGCVYADEFGDISRASFSIASKNDAQCTVTRGGTNSDFINGCLDGTTTIDYDSFSATKEYHFTTSSGTQVKINSGGCDSLLEDTIDGSKVSIISGALDSIRDKDEAYESCATLCENECSASPDIDFEPFWAALSVYVSSTDLPENKASIEISVDDSVILKDKEEDEYPISVTEYGYLAKNFSVDSKWEMYLSGSWSNGGVGYSATEDGIDDRFKKSLIVTVEDTPENYDQGNSSPLFDLWSCSYNSIEEYRESSCESTQSDGAFSITSSKKSENLGIYGGMVRYADEEMYYPNYDNVVCDFNSASISCSDPSNEDNNINNFIVDFASKEFSTDILNNLDDSELYGFSFKILGPDLASVASQASSKNIAGSCLVNIEVINQSNISFKGEARVRPLDYKWNYVEEFKNVDGGLIKLPFFTPDSIKQINVTVAGTWKQSDEGADILCTDGNLAIKFDKVKKIKFENSGLVSFKGLSGANVSTCGIKTNIINPANSIVDDSYLEFDETSTLEVNDVVWATSDKLSVRKGQEILFYPSSWSGYRSVYTSDTNILTKRECGIGIAMKVEARPAIFCDFAIQGYSLSNECSMEVNDSGEYTGWCDDGPIESCISSDNFCAVGSYEELSQGGSYNCEVSTCSADDTQCLDSCKAKCDACKVHIDSIKAKKTIPFVSELVSNRICYNLENYTGRKSDLQSTTTLPSFPTSTDGVYQADGVGLLGGYYSNLGSQGNLSEEAVGKGAEILNSISNSDDRIGYIGDSFMLSVDGDGNVRKDSNGNPIYQLLDSVNINANSLVKFFVYDIDGDYTNNAGNGYNLIFNQDSKYSNGEQLEMKVCYNSGDMSKCVLGEEGSSIDKKIVVAGNSTQDDYYFDNEGRLNNEELTEKYIFDKEGLCKAKYVEDSDQFNDCKEKIDLYFKIKDPDTTATPYNNNEGSYGAEVLIKDAEGGIATSFIANVIDSLIQEVEVYVERMYKNIVTNDTYQTLLSLSLVLYVMFYGLNFLMGTTKMNQTELLNRLVKIGFIYLFVSPAGWQFYNTYFVGLFRNGVDYIVFSLSAIFGNDSIISEIGKEAPRRALMFNGIDETLGLIFNSSSLSKIFGMFFSSLTGWLSCLVLLYSILGFIFAVANAILLYTIAQLFTIILLILGPIFFISLLFENTKGMFDKWLKSLIGFAMQQIVLLTAISLFFVLFRELIKATLGYTVCVGDIWTLTIPYIEQKFTVIRGYVIPRSSGTDMLYSPSAPSLFRMLSLYLVASLMQKYVTFSSDIGEKIADTPLDVGNLSSGISGFAQKVWNDKGDIAGTVVDNTLKYGVGSVASLVGRPDIGTKAVSFRREYISPSKLKNKAKEFALGKELSPEKEKEMYDTLALKKDFKEGVDKRYNKVMEGVQSKFDSGEIDSNEYLETSKKVAQESFDAEAKDRSLSSGQIKTIKSDTDTTNLNMGMAGFLSSRDSMSGFDGSELYNATRQDFFKKDTGIAKRDLGREEIKDLGSRRILSSEEKNKVFDQVVESRDLRSKNSEETLEGARDNYVSYDERYDHYNDMKNMAELGKGLSAAKDTNMNLAEVDAKKKSFAALDSKVRRQSHLAPDATKDFLSSMREEDYSKATESTSEFKEGIDSEFNKAINIMSSYDEEYTPSEAQSDNEEQ